MSENIGAGTNTTSAAESVTEFLVAGIGASAGGLDAITVLLREFPANAPVSVVFIQHLSSAHESHLFELLAPVSKLPVQWAEAGHPLLPGRVYIIPPRHDLTIRKGRFLLDASAAQEKSNTIDRFFRSLALEFKHRSVGVVLSGNGRDGAVGLQTIKNAGGFTFAQQPESTPYSSMPRAAISIKAVDHVLPPGAIAHELIKLAEQSRTVWTDLSEAADDTGRPEPEPIAAIFHLLFLRTGVDFAEYKQSTIHRRLWRRMVLSKVQNPAAYLDLVQKNREEMHALYESMLINVTEFFRDPDCFAYLREQVIPEILRCHTDRTPLRIWVPGCSTGEEVYSLAILIREQMETAGQLVSAQIFGTDISEAAIAKARGGSFTEVEVAGVSAERLQKYFYRTEGGYAVHKVIRDMCVFARQNVVKDSPFSRLDLISCRNLLIYLGPKLQRKIMPVFHYALRPTGYLVLGNSESVGASTDLFRLLDRRFRIYSRKPATRRQPNFEFSVELAPIEVGDPKPLNVPMSEDLPEPYDIIREADRIVLDRHGPTGVLVSEELTILQFRGDVSRYFMLPAGRASLNLIKMAREGLAAELESAVEQARRKHQRVCKAGVVIVNPTETIQVDIDVTPLEVRGKEPCYLILFVTPSALGASRKTKSKSSTPEMKGGKTAALYAQIEQLKHDLQTTRNYLQSTIEKQEHTNQELRAANEEIQSSNEELQSTNEELETAKEELQSTNEELTTVNEELHSRQLELLHANNDLQNLINSIHLPIIILDQDMRIRRFTPMAEEILNVIPTDVGRPLSDINISLNIPDLHRLMKEVIDSLRIREMEVQDRMGRWYSLRLRPYKTAENKIEGVVMALIDIDELKRTIAANEDAKLFAQAALDSAREPLLALNEQLHVRSANQALYRLFAVSREQTEGRSFLDLIQNAQELTELKIALEGVLPNATSISDFRCTLEVPTIGRREFLLNARQISTQTRAFPVVILSFRPASNQ